MYPPPSCRLRGVQRFLRARAAATAFSPPSDGNHARRPITAPGHSLYGLEFFAPSRNGRRCQHRCRRRGRAAVDVRSSGLLLLVDDRPSSRFECPQREIVSLSLSLSHLLSLHSSQRFNSFFFYVQPSVRYNLQVPTRCIPVYAIVCFFHERLNRENTRVKQCSRYGFSRKNPSYRVFSCTYLYVQVPLRCYIDSLATDLRARDYALSLQQFARRTMSDSESPKPADEVLHHHHPRIPPSLLAWCPAIMPPWCSLLPAAWCNPAALRSAFPGSVYLYIYKTTCVRISDDSGNVDFGFRLSESGIVTNPDFSGLEQLKSS